MSAYIVVNAKVTDLDMLAQYQTAVGPTLVGHDFKVLVGTNTATVLEGTPAGDRVVIMEFPTRDALMAWYNSEAYQSVIGLRFAATEGFAVIVDGR